MLPLNPDSVEKSSWMLFEIPSSLVFQRDHAFHATDGMFLPEANARSGLMLASCSRIVLLLLLSSVSSSKRSTCELRPCWEGFTDIFRRVGREKSCPVVTNSGYQHFGEQGNISTRTVPFPDKCPTRGRSDWKRFNFSGYAHIEKITREHSQGLATLDICRNNVVSGDFEDWEGPPNCLEIILVGGVLAHVFINKSRIKYVFLRRGRQREFILWCEES